MATLVLIRPGSEADWVEKLLSGLAAGDKALEITFGVNLGGLTHQERWDDIKDKKRIEEAKTEEEKEIISQEFATKKEEKERYRLPALLQATAGKVGGLIRTFNIGDGESGYPGGDVSSQQWCDFCSKCPNLEELGLTSCFNADDAVLESLKRHKKLRRLKVTGNDKISGSVTNAIVNKLCGGGSLGEASSGSLAKREDCLVKREDGLAEQETSLGPRGRELDEGSSSEKGPPVSDAAFFPALQHLILTDQAKITNTEFQKMKAERPDVRFCYGKSGGYAAVASMLGFDQNCFFDTHSEGKCEPRTSTDYFYDDYFCDDFGESRDDDDDEF